MRLASLCFWFLCVQARADWLCYRTGPFEVIAEEPRAARAALNRLEQTRHVLGELLGKSDLRSPWPIRVVLPKKSTAPKPMILGRAGWIGTTADTAQVARILIEANVGRMPPGIDEGVVAFLSTLEAAGPKLTLGQLPTAALRTRDWARIHMLSTDERFSGKLRVLLSNLAKGVDPEPAYRNAFEKSAGEIEQEVDAYFAAGKFGTVQTSGKPVNPERQFYGRPVDAAPFLAEVSSNPQAAYTALLNAERNLMEAHEGLGLLALAPGDAAGARHHLEAAKKLGSLNPRVYAGLSDWRKAAELNLNWAEPPYRLAQLESDAGRKVHYLKAATSLDIRNAGYWAALAEAYQSANQFIEAARAWASAENAAADDASRASIHRSRLEIETRRADFEAAEKRRAADEKQRELERLKAEALSRIRSAESRAKQGIEPLPADAEVIPWFETDQASSHFEGLLERVECVKGIARLVVSGSGKKQTRLLVRNPAQVVILGGGVKTLACGVQRPARNVRVEFTARKDSRLLTEGDAQVIEFR